MKVRRRSEWTVYARSILLVGAAITCIFTLQVLFVYQTFQPHFLIAPISVTIFAGLLLGRMAALRRRLRQKSEGFRAIVDIAQEFIYLRRVDGQYEYVPPSCLAFTGYSQQAFFD